jgi:acetyl-CoA C-acetyltransferase
MELEMEPIMVGWGHTPFGRLDQLSLENLIHAAAKEALSSAGIEGKDVDAVWLGHFNSGLVRDSFCSSMVLSSDPGLRYKPSVRCENACASGSAAVYGAIDAIRSGRIRVGLVVGAEKMTSADTAEVTRALGGAGYQNDESNFSFPEIFARYAHAYARTYGDPTEAMAHIAVKNHLNALRNPLAHLRRPLDIQYCLVPSTKNPMIAAPLKLTDCSLISDGAAALVLVAEDMLSDFPRASGFRAYQQVNDFLPMSAKDPAVFEGPRRAIERAYHQAGITVDDLSLAEVHDCFTIAELLMVEALMLARPGEGRKAVIDGATSREGKLPVNLSGGLKAKGHPVGATGVSMHVMAARQVLGVAGEMQLPGASLAMVVNMGGDAVATYASVLQPIKG